MVDLGPAHADLLSAAAGEIGFKTAVGSITQLFSAGGGIVFELNRKSGAILDWATDNLVIGSDGYDEHINAINPRMRFSLRHAAGHVAHDMLFIDERGMKQHEFYNWLKRFSGYQYFIGSRLYDDGEKSIFQSIEFPSSHGPPDKRALAAFGQVARAVGNAWRLKSRRAPGADPVRTESWAPDYLPWSIFILNSSGEVIDMNSAAQALLSEGEALCGSVDGLRAVHRPSQAAFRRAISRGLRGEAAECLVTASTQELPLIAQIIPANYAGACVPLQAAAILYISNPMKEARNSGAVLTRLFGFTQAEQNLAKELRAGFDLAEAAKRLGISRNTARNRLQSMYSKTGTRKQTEFLLRVGNILDV